MQFGLFNCMPWFIFCIFNHIWAKTGLRKWPKKWIKTDQLSSTWYNKPTDTGLILNYHALAPRRFKQSVVSGFLHPIAQALPHQHLESKASTRTQPVPTSILWANHRINNLHHHTDRRNRWNSSQPHRPNLNRTKSRTARSSAEENNFCSISGESNWKLCMRTAQMRSPLHCSNDTLKAQNNIAVTKTCSRKAPEKRGSLPNKLCNL